MLHNINDFRFATVGFDNLFDWFNTVSQTNIPNFPPHDIIQLSDTEYRIDMACAGYDQDSISLDFTDGVLTVASKKLDSDNNGKEVYRGISKKSFKKTFTLADDIEVKRAIMKNGMLSVYLNKILPKKQSIMIEIE